MGLGLQPVIELSIPSVGEMVKRVIRLLQRGFLQKKKG
jgi:hypothetical protein